jgi:hypothetical protein
LEPLAESLGPSTARCDARLGSFRRSHIQQDFAIAAAPVLVENFDAPFDVRAEHRQNFSHLGWSGVINTNPSSVILFGRILGIASFFVIKFSKIIRLRTQIPHQGTA